MDPLYPLVPIVNLLCCVLVLLPVFIKFRRSWNTGVCMLAIWASAESFSTGVNSIVWSDNVNDVAPVWCDISEHCSTVITSSSRLTMLHEASHILVSACVAKPACSLVINRRLYRIVALQNCNVAAKRNVSVFRLLKLRHSNSHALYKPDTSRIDI